MASYLALIDDADKVVGLQKIDSSQKLFERIRGEWVAVPELHPGFDRYESVAVSEDLIPIFDFEIAAGREVHFEDFEDFIETVDTKPEEIPSSTKNTLKSEFEIDEDSQLPRFQSSGSKWLSPVHGIFLVNAESEIEKFDERESEILKHRLGAEVTKTLEEIGRNFGVTRERIRQIESQVKEKLGSRGITRLSEVCAFKEPFLMKRSQLVRIFPVLDIRFAHDVSVLDILIATGKITRIDKEGNTWFGHGLSHIKSGQSQYVTLEKFVEDVQNRPRLRTDVQEDLRRLGVRGQIFSDFLSDFGLMVFNDVVCAVNLKLGEFLLNEFARVGRPLHVDEIERLLGTRWTKAACMNLLGTDEQFMRVDRNKYALTDWKLRPYRGIKEEILEIVEKNGPTLLSEIKDNLLSWFSEIAEQSIATYATHPPLVTSNGIVSIDDQAGAAIKPLSQLANFSLKCIFRTESGFAARIDLNAEHIRGSGWGSSIAYASIIGIQRAETWERKFQNSEASLKINFVRAQVEFGSIKAALDEVGAEVGDHLIIFFDGQEGDINEVWFELIPNDRLSKDPIQRAMQLCAVDSNATDPRSAITFAMKLNEGNYSDLTAVATARRDNLLLSALTEWEFEN